jgi:hypothetical protein
MAAWLVNITDEADADLRRLRRVRKKVWRQADALLDVLENDPLTLGEPCDPPLVGVRSLHFWNDKYRMVWLVVETDERVDVLACGLKDSEFYRRVEERLAGLLGL